MNFPAYRRDQRLLANLRSGRAAGTEKKVQPTAFQSYLEQYQTLLEQPDGPALYSSARIKTEVVFNRISPFSRATEAYVYLFLLVRIYLQGRPPVTNLYSSAIFVG